MLSSTLVRFCLALPLTLIGCGGTPSTPEASSVKCGGGSEIGRLASSAPGNDGVLAFDGTYNEHALHVELARDGAHAQLSIDGANSIDLVVVAQVYCSDSLGVYGDAATRAASKVLITLNRTETGERSLQVGRWEL